MDFVKGSSPVRTVANAKINLKTAVVVRAAVKTMEETTSNVVSDQLYTGNKNLKKAIPPPKFVAPVTKKPEKTREVGVIRSPKF